MVLLAARVVVEFDAAAAVAHTAAVARVADANRPITTASLAGEGRLGGRGAIVAHHALLRLDANERLVVVVVRGFSAFGWLDSIWSIAAAVLTLLILTIWLLLWSRRLVRIKDHVPKKFGGNKEG